MENNRIISTLHPEIPTQAIKFGIRNYLTELFRPNRLIGYTPVVGRVVAGRLVDIGSDPDGTSTLVYIDQSTLPLMPGQRVIVLKNNQA